MGHGHAPSHATFWSTKDNIVFAGDQVLPGISPNLGVYPTEPEADTVGDWITSCKKLLRVSDNNKLVLPGHKLPFTGLSTRLEQLIRNHRSALQRIERRLIKGLQTRLAYLNHFKEIKKGIWFSIVRSSRAYESYV